MRPQSQQRNGTANLVVSFDPFEHEGTIVLPMELLDGESLAHRLKRGPLAPSEAVTVLAAVCEAVHAVHQAGVIHRDLKPLNIFLAQVDGRTVPKVLDFGAAREVDDDEHTRTGLVVGSPFYMAPEQALGRRDLDARCDVFALGVILYHCVSGRRPYESTEVSSALAKLIRQEPFPSPRELGLAVPLELERALQKALAWERTERFASAGELANALRAVPPMQSGPTDPNATLLVEPVAVAESGVRSSASHAASPPGFASPPPRSAPESSNGRAMRLVAAALIGASAVALLLFIWFSWRQPAPTVTVDLGAATHPAAETPSVPPVSTVERTLAPEPADDRQLPGSSETEGTPASAELASPEAPPTPRTDVESAPRARVSPTRARSRVEPAGGGVLDVAGRRAPLREVTPVECGESVGIPCID